MAKRQAPIVVPTPDCGQGEDAFVVVRRMTWGEARALTAAAKDDNSQSVGRELAACVTAWNWCDVDSNPIPLPLTPEAVEGLTVSEVMSLRKAVGEAYAVPLPSGGKSITGSG